MVLSQRGIAQGKSEDLVSRISSSQPSLASLPPRGAVHGQPARLTAARAVAAGQPPAIPAELHAPLDAECSLGSAAASERCTPAVQMINDTHVALSELCSFSITATIAVQLAAVHGARIPGVHLHLRRGALEERLSPAIATGLRPA